jgi:hypothetical protein
MSAPIPITAAPVLRVAKARARQFNYGPNVTRALLRQAAREASTWERPEDTATRIVRPPHASATQPSGRPAA